MKGYDYPYERNFISEEEFVFDSLTNNELFLILKNTNLKMLHLINEDETVWNDMAWDDPDKDFKPVTITGGEDTLLSVVNDDEDSDKS